MPKQRPDYNKPLSEWTYGQSGMCAYRGSEATAPDPHCVFPCRLVLDVEGMEKPVTVYSVLYEVEDTSTSEGPQEPDEYFEIMETGADLDAMDDDQWEAVHDAAYERFMQMRSSGDAQSVADIMHARDS